MSGIAAVYNIDGRPVSVDKIQSVMDRLIHRGDDDHGLWLDGSIGLGHRMRWTTAESLREKLPLKAAESSTVITCDARIDNRDELIPQLAFSNKPGNEITDSEIVLRAYEKWGEDCLPRLLGDFVFAIWDARQNKLFCARDPLGVKHFYYHHRAGKLFALASEIKALLRLEDVPCEIDEDCLADYLVVNTENKENTFYKNILRLPATHALVVTRDGIRIWEYWRPTTSEIKLRNDKDYHEAFREKFTEAVHCRLRSAYPIGATLSGGLDSSAVTCVASRLLKNEGEPPLHTFSGVFPAISDIDSRIDERRYMHSVVEKAGCNAHFVDVDHISPLHDVDNIISHTDQPMGHLNVFMAFELFKAAQGENVRVLLTGHDGDCTVSYGYEDFELLVRRGRFIRLLKEAVALNRNIPDRQHSLKALAWERGIKPVVPEAAVRTWRMLRRRKPSTPSPVVFSLHLDSVSEQFRHRHDLVDRISRYGTVTFSDEASRTERHWSVLTNGLFAAMHEQGEKLAAACGIEQRHPFFDRRLIEFCGRLPAGHRLYRGWTRSIFRFAMQDILPADVQWRKDKARLGAHIMVNLFKYPSKELDKIRQKNVDRLAKYVDVKKLRATYESCISNPKKREQEVLLVLTSVYLLNWLERFETART